MEKGVSLFVPPPPTPTPSLPLKRDNSFSLFSLHVPLLFCVSLSPLLSTSPPTSSEAPVSVSQMYCTRTLGRDWRRRTPLCSFCYVSLYVIHSVIVPYFIKVHSPLVLETSHALVCLPVCVVVCPALISFAHLSLCPLHLCIQSVVPFLSAGSSLYLVSSLPAISLELDSVFSIQCSCYGFFVFIRASLLDLIFVFSLMDSSAFTFDCSHALNLLLGKWKICWIQLLLQNCAL